jgi:hypothetical protein
VAGRGLDVDVVDPHPGAADHAQAAGGGEDLGGDLCLAAHHERVVPGDARDQLGGLETGHDVHLGGGAEALHPVGRDGVGDEDAQGAAVLPDRGGGLGQRRLGLDAQPTPAGWPLTWTLRTTA